MARPPRLELTEHEAKEIQSYLEDFLDAEVHSAEVHLTEHVWFKFHKTRAISVFKSGHTQEVFANIIEFENYFRLEGR